MSKSRYRISAVSVITSLGDDLASLAETVFSGGPHGFTSAAWSRGARPCWLGRIDDRLVNEPCGIPDFESRNARITMRALAPLRDRVASLVADAGADRVGVVLGSSTSGISEGEEMMRSMEASGVKPAGYRYAQQEMGTVSAYVARAMGVQGPSYTVSTACSSSAKVFRSARALLDMDMCDAVIVGGVDSLCSMTIEGFGSLDLISPDPCNPFSKNRRGISIGEGAALMLLERGDTGIQLLGVGESSDAYHMATPDPEGRGATAAMRAALADAGVTPNDISYVNLHGTGTLHNDQMESHAMTSVFPHGVPCSSTKGYTGHLLGASGAVEIAVVCAVLMQDGEARLPVHRWDGCTDPLLPPVDLVTASRTVNPTKTLVCMSNSFGFGGSNCSVILARSGERS